MHLLKVLPDQLPAVPDKYATAKLLMGRAMEPITEELDKYYYRDQPTAERVIDYALKMVVNNPGFNDKRVIRKTVEYFKLKLKQ